MHPSVSNGSFGGNSSGASTESDSNDSFEVVEIKDSPNDNNDEEDCVAQIIKSSKGNTLIRPPIGRQILDIEKIVEHYHEQLEEGLSSNETESHALFIISAKWFNSFLSLANKTSTSLLFGEDDECDVNRVTSVLAIDNTSLLSASSLSHFNADRTAHLASGYSLHDDVKLNEDYFLLPQEAWRALCGWYGVIGPALPRLLFEVQTPQMGSEIFLTNSRKFRLFAVECLLYSDHHSGHNFKNTVFTNDEEQREFQLFLHPAAVFSQQQVVNLPDLIAHMAEDSGMSAENRYVFSCICSFCVF
jgi:hypothetical protein